ncbi:class I SAM-dependent methyltransferase [Novosphingobium lentum]|uniref:class I SAM-dependent methyltransferase n=1 Tax=Novosphingobium lentum TaxID=145287 RepID=UPI000830085F|nr:class I SAM-dependent methyltransferase [Novosphingobium lentum]
MDVLTDLRCVYCNGTQLQAHDRAPSERIQHGAIACGDCGGLHDIVDGVPFMGGFEPEDFLGLIEVVATGEMNQTPIDVGFSRYLHTLLGQYHDAPDKADFVRSHPDDMVRAPWFADHRYHEWMQSHAMLFGKDLTGKSILNVGAGFGFDSVPLVDSGASVTCIDYSPMIVALGKKGLPEARWVGGFSHALPFQDDSFDIVCCNAALHHMRSAPVALREMLRVLKPGGFMYTCGDPTRADSSDDSLEFEVFNRHEGVLSGINEGIIRFGDIYDTLAAYSDHIDLALIASVPDGLPIEGASSLGNASFPDSWVPCWPQNIAVLRDQAGGGLCVAVTKREAFAIPAEKQSPFVLPAGILAAWVTEPETAFARLMAWAPEDLVNLPFPGDRQDWFSLLNGWMAPEDPFERRRGFQRTRWLLRHTGAQRLVFGARMVAGSGAIDVFLNGKLVHSADLGSDWTEVAAIFPVAASDIPFLIELRLKGDLAGKDFDERCFEICNRRID